MGRVFSLILCLLGIQLEYAHATSAPDWETDPSLLIPIESEPSKPIRDIYYFSANDKEVNGAACKAKISPSIDYIRAYFEKTRRNQSLVSEATIGGLRLKNQTKRELRALRDLTSGVDLTKKASNCSSVECVLGRVFSGDVGLKLLYIYDKHGFNGSHYAFDHASEWTSEELDVVLLAVRDLPEQRNPFKNKQLTHFKRGYSYALYKDKNVAANASIEFFDGWNQDTPLGQQNAVFHEIAHNLGEKLESDPDWKKLFADKNAHVSQYAKTNIAEDVAESITGYRYNPNYLLAVSPKKYEIIKRKIFNGIEFTSVERCSGISDSDRKQMVSHAVSSVISSQPVVQSLLEAIGTSATESVKLNSLKLCKSEFGSPQTLTDCLKQKLPLPAIEKLAPKIPVSWLELSARELDSQGISYLDYQLAHQSRTIEIIRSLLVELKSSPEVSRWVEQSVADQLSWVNEMNHELSLMTLERFGMALRSGEGLSCVANAPMYQLCNDAVGRALIAPDSQEMKLSVRSCIKDRIVESCRYDPMNYRWKIADAKIKSEELARTEKILGKYEAAELARKNLTEEYQRSLEKFRAEPVVGATVQSLIQKIKAEWPTEMIRVLENVPNVTVSDFSLKLNASTDQSRSLCEKHIGVISKSHIEGHMYIQGFSFGYSQSPVEADGIKSFLLRTCKQAGAKQSNSKLILPIKKMKSVMSQDIAESL